jgi:NAD(P)-dependent dehydrogenase (short-subunit alcohol dehydrogenase family)
MHNLEGKVAVVLGASAERGTGWGIAETLAAHGAKVVVSARSLPPLQNLAAKINGTAVACDVGDEAQVIALAKQATDTYGKLDIAVNSAGLPMIGMIADAQHENLEAAIRLNYYGNVYFVKYMAEAIGENGSITLISSLTTTHPLVPHFAYACAKAAADCLVRYAALEYGPRRIKVNSILPGPIVSDLSQELLGNPAGAAAFVRETPLRRLGYPADVADAVLCLAGPAFVTGLNLPVNGGMQLTRFPYLDELPAGPDTFGAASGYGEVAVAPSP